MAHIEAFMARQGEFALSGSEALVLLRLLYLADEEGRVSVSMRQIAQETRKSVGAVSASMAKLIGKGLVSVERAGKNQAFAYSVGVRFSEHRCSGFDTQCSGFDTQCSGFDTQCSGFDTHSKEKERKKQRENKENSHTHTACAHEEGVLGAESGAPVTLSEARKLAESQGLLSSEGEAWWYFWDARGWAYSGGRRIERRVAASSLVSWAREDRARQERRNNWTREYTRDDAAIEAAKLRAAQMPRIKLEGL